MKRSLAGMCLLAAVSVPASANPAADASTAARQYSERIEALDDQGPEIRAVIVHAANAAEQAEAVQDSTLLAGRTVLVKDNIETREWPTTAGSLALKDNATGRDAPLIARIRESGGVILGKTNLSEWANIRDNNSSSGWSAVGGLTRNPHATDRNACGSSSGSGAAVAAGFAWAAIGTETNGSITCPASVNGIVGFKPTVGMVSRTHVVPISATQDTAGPMTQSVHDAALLLSAMAGADAADPATVEADIKARDFTEALADYSLKGVRIGVMVNQVGSRSGVTALFNQARTDLEAAGAELVEIEYDWPDGFWPNSLTVLLYELQRDMNAYLATLDDPAMPDTLADLVAFNRANADMEMRWFGQDLFEQALETTDEAAYLEALEMVRKATQEDGIDRLRKEYDVEYLIAPTLAPPGQPISSMATISVAGSVPARSPPSRDIRI